MTKQHKIIRAKVGLLELAKQLGNVSQACKILGYSRDSFYRFKDLYHVSLTLTHHGFLGESGVLAGMTTMSQRFRDLVSYQPTNSLTLWGRFPNRRGYDPVRREAIRIGPCTWASRSRSPKPTFPPRVCASWPPTPATVRRLLAIGLILEGCSRAEAARLNGVDRQTLRDWVHRYKDDGVSGLRSRVSPGRPAAH